MHGDWTEVSRGHNSCSTSVVNEGPNIDDKEESDSLSTVQPIGDTLLLAKESVTSFEPRSIKLRTGTRQPSESMEKGQK